MSHESMSDQRPDRRKFGGSGFKGLLVDLSIYLVVAGLLALIAIGISWSQIPK